MTDSDGDVAKDTITVEVEKSDNSLHVKESGSTVDNKGGRTSDNDGTLEASNSLGMGIDSVTEGGVKYSGDIPEEYKEHEKKILIEQLKNDPKNASKPENIIEKMIVGRLNKELKEVCLLDQAYVKAEDGKQAVGKYVEQVAKANGANVTIKGFVRFETGEGIEKKEEDFAAEVAAQLK